MKKLHFKYIISGIALFVIGVIAIAIFNINSNLNNSVLGGILKQILQEITTEQKGYNKNKKGRLLSCKSTN